MEAPFDIKCVQARLLQMAKTTADILEKHNIPYQIAFGTLLGAVRHGGFIPWDDDFDFLLFDDSYDKATEVLAKELPADLFLEDEKTEPKYFHAWAHVKDLKSECDCSLFPQDAMYKNHGLSVDLYKLTRIKEKDFAVYRLDQAISYIDRRKKLGFITEEEYEKKKEIFLREFKEREAQEKQTKASEKEILAYPFTYGKQEINDVFPLKKYKFEGVEFLGPNNYHPLLASEYGDYMQLPPEEDRHPHFSKVEFNS